MNKMIKIVFTLRSNVRQNNTNFVVMEQDKKFRS